MAAISRRTLLSTTGASLAVSPFMVSSASLVTSYDARRALTAVRVFPSYRTSVYGQHDAVLRKLGDLGIKRMSHKLTPAIARSADVIAFTQEAHNLHGITSWLTMGEPHTPLSASEWDEMVAALTGPLAGMVERVYGWNEPNHIRGRDSPPSDWVTMTATHQAELWKRVSPLGIQVGTPQLWSGDLDVHDADATELGPTIRGNFDHIGWHLYPRSGGAENARNIDRFYALYSRIFGPGFPVVCTEAGYLDAASYTGGATSVTAEQKAVLVRLLVEEYRARGWGISYFELLDDPDPTDANREANLGLVECPAVDSTTWTDKPAFDALRGYLG